MWQQWTENGPKGCPCCAEPCCSLGSRYNRTTHGWIDAQTFTEWFVTSFLPHARRLPGKKVLVGDNLASHFTDKVIQLCQENDICFVCLPPNATHLIQPLDVGFFRPLKAAWRTELTQFKMRNLKCTGIPKQDFPRMLQSTLNRLDGTTKAIKTNLESGFRATGLHPLNPDQVLRKLPDSSLNEETINDSLVEYLRKQRHNEGNSGRRRKRTKLNVVPGASVTAASVQSDSDSDVPLPTNDISDVENVEDQDDEVEPAVCTQPTPEEMNVGTFVLVKVLSGKRKSITYHYAAIIQEKLNQNEYKVMGLKSMDTAKTVFKSVEDDLFSVTTSEIIAVLPEPSVEQSGNRLRYKFGGAVAVHEC